MASIRKARRRIARWDRYWNRYARLVGPAHLVVPRGADRALDELERATLCRPSCRCFPCQAWRNVSTREDT